MREFIFGNTRFKLLNVLEGIIKNDIQGHSHSKNSFELHYIAKGKGVLNTDSESFSLAEGSFFVTGPETWHSQLTDKNDPVIEYCIYLQIEEDARDTISCIFSSRAFYIGNDNDTVRYGFEQAISLIGDKNIFTEQKQIIFIQLIMNELASLYSPSITNDSSYTPDDRKNIIIEDAFLYDYKDVTLASLAERLGLSERQTQRLVQRNFGKTFSEKKTEARLEKAKLLLEEDHSVREIAKMLGYANASNFERAYKNHFGKTAKQKI